MFFQKAVVFVMLVVLCGLVPSLASAELNASDKDVSVRRLGVALNIAEDRKMENIAGIYQPEGLDKYMQRYFAGLSAKVDRVIDQNNRLEKKVDELISKTDQALAAQQMKKS
ncbi:MAG: hypothetical protein PHV97_04245 [Candidatus Omnitrophica bacterium]|nr:hypothetical protein [Candidatus Omnitrophota bacterium]